MKFSENSERLERWITRVVLLFFVAITIYPIVFVTINSLKSTDEFYANVWALPKAIHWSNYSEAWFDAKIGQYFTNSTIVVVIAVLIISVFGVMAGYALGRLNLPYAEAILLFFLAMKMVPHESLVMPLYLMMSRMGIIGEHISLILPYAGWGLPIAVYILKNYFQSIPNSLLEAARIDGASEWLSFRKIMVPLAMPAIATVIIFNFVSLWGELLWATVALSTATMKTLPLGIIVFQSEFATDWGPLSAAICMVMLPLVLVFLFMQKYFVQGITAGANKG
ncbi:carbohydrate ABC transporter permease [Cohnella sp. LGH]|uniref:Carbohydrate ABC transporter membrane protein 2 (CUT1 family) n=1 Tax=Cohnella phaseoli TaxID=456490 RepID=A0A3D9I9W1_9BACL|nr:MULTISPECIES: carbohydrate ABC transporter permease [Cohnella]QTH42015.1 carbohydrate ABC transporter permease [Cohnella sp. LGH]RED57956.1 carbohydrate ABC transporter membrane protein 2 (CUT1 family) [Cohnella phaseoli]